MHAARRRIPGRACEEARSLASLELDGQLGELGARTLWRHLERCAECAALVGELGAVVAMLRAAALEPVPRLFDVGRRRRRTAARRASWARGAVAVAAVGAVVVSLPNASTAPSPLRPVVAAVDVPAWSAAPARLPIGQRSAGSDFAAGPRPLRA